MAELCSLWGPCGREAAVAQALARHLAGLAGSVDFDPVGNVVAVRPGTQPGGSRILLAAHMDGPGGVITGALDRGLLAVAPVGGLALPGAFGQRVRFADGRPGVLAGDPVAEAKDLKWDRCWVDIGASSRDEALAQVREGDLFALDAPPLILGGRLVAPNLQGRAGCAALVQVLRELDASPHTVQVACTVQGQAGPHGLRAVVDRLQPDLVVLVTGSGAGREGAHPRPGGGPALRLKDGGWVLRSWPRAALAAAAAAAGLEPQTEVLASGGPSPLGAVESLGVPAACIAIPLRCPGTAAEAVEAADVRRAVDWILALLRQPLPPRGT